MADEHAPFTLRAAAGLPPLYGPMNDAVLIVIDAQLEYHETGALALPNLEPALANIVALLDAGRSAGSEIVHIAHEGSAGRAFDPQRGGRIFNDVAPLEGEPVLGKGLPNSFAHTGLQNHLAGIGRPHLILCGFMTHMCISSTARAALDLGYETTVVSVAPGHRWGRSDSGSRRACSRPRGVGRSVQCDKHDGGGHRRLSVSLREPGTRSRGCNRSLCGSRRAWCPARLRTRDQPS